MASTLNWELREHIHCFRDGGGDGSELRLTVLLELILYSNQNNRTWVGRDRIAKNIGASEARVSAAIQWLFEHGAIYNVPYKYRIGDERTLEHRKYVFQLTGLIRFGEKVIPYLYLHDLDSEIAALLRKLEDMGAHKLVEFLTQSTDSEHSEFLAQGTDSEHSESEHKGSIAEGSTISKDNYSPAATSGGKQKGLLSEPFKDLKDSEKMQRSSGEEIVESLNKKLMRSWTELEQFVMAVTGMKVVANTYRTIFNSPVVWYDDKGGRHESSSPNSLWSEAKYQKFVREQIVVKLQQRSKLTARGFSEMLGSPRVYNWYFGGNSHGETPTTSSEPPVIVSQGFHHPFQEWFEDETTEENPEEN